MRPEGTPDFPLKHCSARDLVFLIPNSLGAEIRTAQRRVGSSRRLVSP